jgi:hypothetical protein
MPQVEEVGWEVAGEVASPVEQTSRPSIKGTKAVISGMSFPEKSF